MQSVLRRPVDRSKYIQINMSIFVNQFPIENQDFDQDNNLLTLYTHPKTVTFEIYRVGSLYLKFNPSIFENNTAKHLILNNGNKVIAQQKYTKRIKFYK